MNLKAHSSDAKSYFLLCQTRINSSQESILEIVASSGNSDLAHKNLAIINKQMSKGIFGDIINDKNKNIYVVLFGHELSKDNNLLTSCFLKKVDNDGKFTYIDQSNSESKKSVSEFFSLPSTLKKQFNIRPVDEVSPK